MASASPGARGKGAKAPLPACCAHSRGQRSLGQMPSAYSFARCVGGIFGKALLGMFTLRFPDTGEDSTRSPLRTLLSYHRCPPPGVSSTWLVIPSTGILLSCLESGYLLQLPLDLKEDSGRAGHPHCCPLFSPLLRVSSSQPPNLRLLYGEAASVSIFLHSAKLLETLHMSGSPQSSLKAQAPTSLQLSKYPSGG